MTCISSSIKSSLILLALTFPFQIFAEPELDSLMGSEDEFLDELPIILSATRLAQPLNESPVAMTVIDRELIDASGARTIPDLLRLVPGFQVGYFDGNSPVAAYHGHSGENSKRVQVLVDGRSIYVPSLAGIPWQDMAITIDDIDKIEVTRGPNASTYGNNSFFGVVSIFTRHAAEDTGHKLKVVTGSKETADAYYSYSTHADDLDLRITVGTKNDNGTDFLNDSTEADFLNYRFDFQLDTDSRLSYQGGLKDILKGDHEPTPDHSVDVAYAFQQLELEHQISNRQSLSLQYYYNYHKAEEFVKTVTVPDIPFGAITIDGFSLASTLNIKSERHDIEFNYYFTGDEVKLVSGLSARLDTVTADNVFDENGSLNNDLYRAFINIEYKASENWLINTGILAENNDISGNDLSPRIAVIHTLSENHTFRVGASRATRTPVLWEENANYRLTQLLTQNGGNPLDFAVQTALFGAGNETDILNNQFQISSGNLKSEEIVSFELGYIAQLLDNKLTLDFKLFKDKTDYLITEISNVFAPDDNFDTSFLGGLPSPIANDFQNTHKTKIEGFEFSFNYQEKNNFRLYGYYTYLDIQGIQFNPFGDDAWSDRLRVSAPKRTYNLTFIKHWPKNFNSSLLFYYSDTYDWLDRTRVRNEEFWKDRNVHAYKKVDIKFDKSYSYGKEQLNIALVLQNIADDFYDYTRPEYTGPSLTTVSPPTSINKNGSLQDRRTYIEISFLFN
jgi:iron complex outermembrane recepter protein